MKKNDPVRLSRFGSGVYFFFFIWRGGVKCSSQNPEIYKVRAILLLGLAGPHPCARHATERETSIHFRLTLVSQLTDHVHSWNVVLLGKILDVRMIFRIGLARETKDAITGLNAICLAVSYLPRRWGF